MPRKPRKQATESEDAIGKADLKHSALEAWRKLDAVIQAELTSIQNGHKELNASTTTAVVKFIEASVSLASGPDDLSPKDTTARLEKIYANLPTFSDDDDNQSNQEENNQ